MCGRPLVPQEVIFTTSSGDVAVEMLGRFRVSVSGTEIPATAWPSRRSAELVQLLALTDGFQLPREHVMDALWPQLEPGAAAANLRKAAHFARQALGDTGAVVLRGGQVALFPARTVRTDVANFEKLADDALARRDASACTAAAAAYCGDLLPGARYEGWSQTVRDRLRARYVELLRCSGQWERLVDLEPTDEPAYQVLMQAALRVGNRGAAIRWYGRLSAALRSELGVAPGRDTEALYEECVAGLVATPTLFVGRDLELARARALLDDQTRHHDQPRQRADAIMVSGPAGIGKSAFCDQLARLAHEAGWAVVAVEVSPEQRPYGPVATVVGKLIAAQPGLLGAMGERAAVVLGQLTPAARAPAPGGQLTRHQIIGALRRCLMAAGARRPVLVVIDDAHLMDDASSEVFVQLAVAGWPMMIALSYRRDAGSSTLQAGAARLARQCQLLTADLEPLELDQAATLAAHAAPTAVPPAVLERIVTLGGGNPFATLELARSVAADGSGQVPANVREAIAARLCDLNNTSVAILRKLALAGDDFDSSTAVALTGLEEADAFALLDRALAGGVLAVVDGRYRFRHELVRQALVEQIPPHHRRAIHRSTAQRLAELDASPALVARHWLAAGQPRKAVEPLLAAAREALRLGAFAEAVQYADSVLADQPGHATALTLRAEALDAVGDPRAPVAYAAAEHAVGAAEAHELRAKRALAELRTGDPEGALQTLAAAVPVTVEGRLAEALTLSSAAALGYADPALGTAKAAESRRLAIESGDNAALVLASWAQAAAAHARGDLRYSVWADVRDTRDLPHLAAQVFDGQLCVTQRLLYGARPYPEVIAFANELATEAKRLGAARGHAFAITLRGEAELLAGQLDAADADLAEATRLNQDIDAATGEALALQRRAEVARYRGDIEAASRLLDQALEVARSSEVGFHLLDRIYGTRLTLAEDALPVLAEAEQAVRGPLETCPGCRITFAVPAGIAAARGGDLDRAADYLRSAEWLAGVVMRLPAWDAALLELRGHLALARGEAASATGYFAEAAARFGSVGQPLDEARCAALAADLGEAAAVISTAEQ